MLCAVLAEDMHVMAMQSYWLVFHTWQQGGWRTGLQINAQDLGIPEVQNRLADST